MAFCLQATGWIHRQLSVFLSPAFLDRTRSLPLRGQAHRFVLDQLGDGEAVMGLDERQIAELKPGLRERALPSLRAPFELENVALRHRQEILHVRGGTERNRLLELERSLHVRKNDGSGAIRNQRAVGALQRPGDEWILLAFGTAEVVTQ